MEAVDQNFIDLITTAEVLTEADATVADRTVIFTKIIDVFLCANPPEKSRHRNKLLSVLDKLLPHVETSARDHTVARLMVAKDPPMDLVNHIVLDDPERVAPLLRSMTFDEDDLVEIVQKTTRAHHHELAVRDDLSANVWIALARAAPDPDRNSKTQAPLRAGVEPLIPVGGDSGAPTSRRLRLVQSDGPSDSDDASATNSHYRGGERANKKAAHEAAIQQTMALLQAATDRMAKNGKQDPDAAALDADIIATCTKTLAELTEDN